MPNSIIEAQFDFFHDRTISEPSKEVGFVSTLGLMYIPGLFPTAKKIDKAPVDKMYVYSLPDIVITFQDEVYRLATTLSEAEARKPSLSLIRTATLFISSRRTHIAQHIILSTKGHIG